MYRFSASSNRKLDTCDIRLQHWARTLILTRDCTVITGYRNSADQALAYKAGLSKLKPGQSLHNVYPSRAIDIVPAGAPKLWAVKKDLSKKEYIDFAKFGLSVASGLGLNLRWGGDWDMDGDFNDQTFNDYAHFEIRGV